MVRAIPRPSLSTFTFAPSLCSLSLLLCWVLVNSSWQNAKPRIKRCKVHFDCVVKFWCNPCLPKTCDPKYCLLQGLPGGTSIEFYHSVVLATEELRVESVL